MSPSPVDTAGLRARSKVLRALRAWFDEQGFVEVPTPVRVPSPAMETSLFAYPSADRWLRTSPEFALKRVVSAGLPRIYEIGPCFRDREVGPWHQGEFLMAEWYRVGASLDQLMDDVEGLVAVSAAALGLPAPGPWRRRTVRALMLEATGIDLAEVTAEELCEREPDAWDEAFFRRWLEDVEPSLHGPTFASEWPSSQAALAIVRDDGPWPIAERFEAYLGGIELANAFHELVDGREQRRRFADANALRLLAGEVPHPVDEAFIDAVGRMPPTSGIALGVDRLVAVLMGWSGIGPGRVEA